VAGPHWPPRELPQRFVLHSKHVHTGHSVEVGEDKGAPIHPLVRSGARTEILGMQTAQVVLRTQIADDGA